MSQYGRKLRAGVEDGQHREQERPQAQYNAELAQDQENERQRLQAQYHAQLHDAAERQRHELQAQYARELEEERANVRRQVGAQHNDDMLGMHNEEWQRERALYLEQLAEGRRERVAGEHHRFQEFQEVEEEHLRWNEERQVLVQQAREQAAQMQQQQV